MGKKPGRQTRDAAQALRPKRGQNGTCRLAADLPIATDGKPPTEFRLFSRGMNETDYGPFTFDDVAGAMVMQAYQSDNKGRLQFDFNHGMAAPYPTDEQGKSAGSFVPEVRDDGLWATDCQWTENGYARIASREYSTYSPLFRWDWDEGLDAPRISKLINCALVNIPGLHNIQAIAASAALNGENDMETEELLKKTRQELEAANGRAARAEAELAEQKAKSGTAALAGALGLAGTATPEGVVAAAGVASKFRTDVVALTGAASAEAALGTISGWKEKSAAADRVIAEAGQRETVALAAELEGALTAGVTALKISAADAKDPQNELRLAALAVGGGKPSKEGIAYLSARLAARGPIAGGSGAERPRGSIASTAADIDMSRRMGVDEAKFQEHRAKQVAAGLIAP